MHITLYKITVIFYLGNVYIINNRIVVRINQEKFHLFYKFCNRLRMIIHKSTFVANLLFYKKRSRFYLNLSMSHFLIIFYVQHVPLISHYFDHNKR